MFEKFDTDGSGALDAQELMELYNENSIMVTEDEIHKLYGSNNINFTLQSFEQMNNDKRKLKNFRTVLKKIKPRLVSQSVPFKTRSFVPSTFDTMMADFGTKV